MPLPCEFLVADRPLSLQAKPQSKADWKAQVKSEAKKIWSSPPIEEGDLHVSIVYLCDDSPQPDTDNIVKPILDALIGLVYIDDKLVSDIESHRRHLSDGIDIMNLPHLLQKAVIENKVYVYVKVENAKSLECYL